MTDEQPAAPVPIEWLVHASPQHTVTQIEVAGESGNVLLDMSASLYGPTSNVAKIVGGSHVLQFDLDAYRNGAFGFNIASCTIRAVSDASCIVSIRPRDRDNSQIRFMKMIDDIANHFKRIGIEYEDMRAQNFKGPRARQGSSASITKPSERSMWVDPVFYERPTRKRDDLCFVIMPYRDELAPFFESAVKPVVTDLGLDCKLAKEFRGGHNDIMEEIWVALYEARFIIADLSGQNANVYYELGIAETLGKRVIAIHKKPADGQENQLPFDVRSRRTLYYEDTMAGGLAFQKELREHIKAILQSQA